MSCWITSSICALRLSHLVLRNIGQLLIDIELIDNLVHSDLLPRQISATLGRLLLPIWIRLTPRRAWYAPFHSIILIYALCFIHSGC